tara:strand:- start:141 stop:491 length:351 start_codon:yes stop_codon:yes gene_type:complete
VRNIIVSVLARIANFKWNPTEKRWSRKAIGGTSLGAAGAMTILGQIFGISAVAHGAGGMILTGSAGYISGTFIAGTLVWIIWPLLVFVGIVALFWKQIVNVFDWAVRRIYFLRNDK